MLIYVSYPEKLKYKYFFSFESQNRNKKFKFYMKLSIRFYIFTRSIKEKNVESKIRNPVFMIEV